MVIVGYPEKVDVSPKWSAIPQYYNSSIVINADGETIANYRKPLLFKYKETSAIEEADKFFNEDIEGLGNTAMGTCQ